MTLLISCRFSSVYGTESRMARFITCPSSATIIRTTVLESTGRKLMYFSLLSSLRGISTKDVRFVMSERSSAACSMVLSSSLRLSISLLRIFCLSSSGSSLVSISSSTYSRYALSEGTLPAEVCGCVKYPISSRSDISLRMVAGLMPMSWLLERERLPTGSPVVMKSAMIACRICSFLSFRSFGFITAFLSC